MQTRIAQPYSRTALGQEADEVLGDQFDDPRFLSPGSPRGVWGGIRLNF